MYKMKSEKIAIINTYLVFGIVLFGMLAGCNSEKQEFIEEVGVIGNLNFSEDEEKGDIEKLENESNKDTREYKVPSSCLYYNYIDNYTDIFLPEKWEYDSKGNVVTKYYSYASSDEYYSKDKCYFDEYGNMTLKYCGYISDSEFDSQYTYSYDEKNRLIREDKYCINLDGETVLASSDTYTYISDTEIVHGNGEYDLWTEYLDEYGNPLNNQYDDTIRYIYTYDEKGNKLSEQQSDSSIIDFYEYNDKNLLIRRTQISNGRESIIDYHYDKNDLLIEEVYVYEDGTEQIMCFYTYDEYGNRLSVNNYVPELDEFSLDEEWIYTY